MNKNKFHINKIIKLMLGFILTLGTYSVNTYCILWLHQPKIPATMLKRRK